MKRFIVVAACVVIGGACASTGTNAAATKREVTSVVIDNQSVLDMRMYVLRGSERVRIGIATGLSTTRLTIPQYLVAGVTSVRFLADPIGGNRNPISEEVTVSEGDEIGLRIPPS